MSRVKTNKHRQQRQCTHAGLHAEGQGFGLLLLTASILAANATGAWAAEYAGRVLTPTLETGVALQATPGLSLAPDTQSAVPSSDLAQSLPAAGSPTLPKLEMGSGLPPPSEMLASNTGDSEPRYAAFDSSFIRGAGGETVDLTRFEHGNPVTPGMQRLDIYLNQSWVGRQDVKVEAGDQPGQARYCFQRDQLTRLGLVVDKLPNPIAARQMLDTSSCIELQKLVPAATVGVDMSELTANVTIPQAYLGRVARGYVEPKYWDGGVNAAFLGYNFNVAKTDLNQKEQSGESTQTYTGINAGVNVADWRLRYNGSYSKSREPDQPSRDRYSSISTYAQRDIDRFQSQLTLGQYFTSSELFDSVPYTGVQLASDDRMLPDSQRGFAPTIRGVADTNAKVTVRQGANILYETMVAPGPFILDDLYNTGYAGDLTVTVSEADGRTKTFVVPYASVAQLLRPGVSRFSITGGEYRDDRLNNRPNFLQGTYQHGISNLWTAYTGGIVAEDYLSALGGVAFSTPYGALAADVTQSHASDMNVSGYGTRRDHLSSSMSGQSYRLTYSKLMEATQTNFMLAAYRFSSEGYLNLADFAELRSDRGDGYIPYRERNRFQINVNQPLGERGGNVFATGIARNYWNSDAGSDVSYQVGYSNGYRWGSFSIGAQRTRDEQGDFDTQYLFSVSIPLGHNVHSPYFSSSLSYDNGKDYSLQNTVSGNAGEQNQFGYSVSGMRNRTDGDNFDTAGANMQYNSPVATFTAGASGGSEYSQANLGIAGSIVAYPGGVNFTQYQGETIAVLEAKGAEGAKVNSNVGAQIASNDHAVVSGLMPYRQNEIELDPKGTSEDVEMLATTQSVAPRFGSVVMLKYPTITGKPVLMTVSRQDGQPFPVGAEVLDMKGNVLAMVGQGGRIFLRGLSPQGQLQVRWGEGAGKSCRLNYQLPRDTRSKDKPGAPFLTTNAVCMPVLGSPQVAGLK
ncbi:Outer membrane usher protein HtrE precursor [compost metagenome]